MNLPKWHIGRGLSALLPRHTDTQQYQTMIIRRMPTACVAGIGDSRSAAAATTRTEGERHSSSRPRAVSPWSSSSSSSASTTPPRSSLHFSFIPYLLAALLLLVVPQAVHSFRPSIAPAFTRLDRRLVPPLRTVASSSLSHSSRRHHQAPTMLLGWLFGPKATQPVVRKGVLTLLVLDPVRRAIELFPSTKAVVQQVWNVLPLALRALINPRDLLLFVTTRLLYRKACRALHAFHQFLWKRVGILDEPRPYEDSVLGFMEPKLGTLTSFIGVTYVINVVLSLLIDIGWRVRADSGRLMASLLYIAYGAFFVNEVKKQYLTTWVPSLQEDRRRSYIIDRSSSVVLWILATFSCIECISAFLKVSLSSTLAFGGIGGLAFGLASKDVVSNFFGGVMLLFTEPFTPGDMVSFTTRGTHYEGKVERVGFYQTRLRGRDTRPTYVPNSVFVDTMVTNMDRITHRRFETSFTLRYQDFETLPEVILEIKKALRVLPKVDVLSPFRVHFTQFGSYSLSLTASCYFATKSLDEYLYLQQLALMEITRVVTECGCRFAYPTTHLDLVPKELGQSLITGVVDYQNELEQVAASQASQGGGGGGGGGGNNPMKGGPADFTSGFAGAPRNPMNNGGGGGGAAGPGAGASSNAGNYGPRPTRGVRIMPNMYGDDDVMPTSVMPGPPFPPPPPPPPTHAQPTPTPPPPIYNPPPQHQHQHQQHQQHQRTAPFVPSPPVNVGPPPAAPAAAPHTGQSPPQQPAVAA